ncbi:MAG: hypothetical protein GF384_05475, partial [Elusimicrobia bacterium]|nr:hypothetical protein [Elusimicrobiota bacterium]
MKISKLKRKFHEKFIDYFGDLSTEAFIVSYPKSGVTWLRVMLGKYVALLADLPKKDPIPLFNEFNYWGIARQYHTK